METEKIARFDHVWRNALDSFNLMVKHFNAMQRSERLCRGAAYDFAKCIMEIQTQFNNDFIDQVQSTGMTVADWIDQHFDYIEQMNDNRQRLFAEIKDGLTRKEYVEGGRFASAKRRAEGGDGKAPGIGIATVVTDSMTAEEQVASLTKALDAANSMIRQMQRDNSELVSEVERLRKSVARAERTLHAAARTQVAKTRATKARRRQVA